MSKQQCTFDGCDRPLLAKGLCTGHYQQQRHRQELKPLQQRVTGRVRCEAGDGLGWSCIRPHRKNSLCNSHYWQSTTGKPFAPIYVVTDATARSVMHAAGFQPDGPYPGTGKPWPGTCLQCGQRGAPCYKHVQQGYGACAYCSGKKVDPNVAVGKMLAAGFQPDGPFPGSLKSWPGVCLKCGKRGAPRYGNVEQGQGACQSCAEHGFNPAKPAVFYTVAGGGWLKCGISNVPDIRLRKHARQGLDQVLHVLHFEHGHDALALEDLWLDRIATIPTLARPTKAELPDGFTEACRDVPMVRRWIEQHLVSLAETSISA